MPILETVTLSCTGWRRRCTNNAVWSAAAPQPFYQDEAQIRRYAEASGWECEPFEVTGPGYSLGVIFATSHTTSGWHDYCPTCKRQRAIDFEEERRRNMPRDDLGYPLQRNT